MTDHPTDDELRPARPPETEEPRPEPEEGRAGIEPEHLARDTISTSSAPNAEEVAAAPDVAAGPPVGAPVSPLPPPSPYLGLPTSAGSVLRQTFDLLTRAGPELRRGSFYIGLIVLGL